MWICLNDAFFSIVNAPGQPDHLLVRARRQGDLQRVFPGHAVQRTPGRDYLFRATVPRMDVANVLAELAFGIDYGNFKNSVREPRLHGAYARVWSIMADLQPVPPYATQRRRPARDLFSRAPVRDDDLDPWRVPGLGD